MARWTSPARPGRLRALGGVLGGGAGPDVIVRATPRSDRRAAAHDRYRRPGSGLVARRAGAGLRRRDAMVPWRALAVRRRDRRRRRRSAHHRQPATARLRPRRLRRHRRRQLVDRTAPRSPTASPPSRRPAPSRRRRGRHATAAARPASPAPGSPSPRPDHPIRTRSAPAVRRPAAGAWRSERNGDTLRPVRRPRTARGRTRRERGPCHDQDRVPFRPTTGMNRTRNRNR